MYNLCDHHIELVSCLGAFVLYRRKMARKFLIVTLFITTYFLSVADAVEVPFINKCKAEDSKCIRDSAMVAIPVLAVGIPNLGVDPLDPLNVDKIDASSPNLKLLLSNIRATGLKNCEVKKVKRDLVKSKIYMKVVCSLEIDGHYDMSGQLLILPIEGHGKAKVILRKAVFAADCNMDDVKKADGKMHWRIKDWKHTFELEDKATIAFENLFNGNQVLALAAKTVIDNNANEIVLDIGRPIVQIILRRVMDTINQFYDAVPGEQLALD